MKQAIDALVDEYRAVLADGEKPVRVECNYFKQNPSADITPGAILSVLERRSSTRSLDDTRIQAYVKWQLLSAIDGKFPPALVKRAIEVYRRTPMLMNRPGSTARDQEALDALARGRVESDLDAIDYKLEQSMAQFNAYNGPLLRYREALYARLPVRFESLEAGFNDLSERIECAIDEFDFRPHAEHLVKDAHAWLASSAAAAPSAEQLSSLARSVERLSKRRGLLYTNLKWRESERRLVWQERIVEADRTKLLAALASELSDRAIAAGKAEQAGKEQAGKDQSGKQSGSSTPATHPG